MRQFAVTCHTTGLVTLVNFRPRWRAGGSTDYAKVSRLAGLYYPADCDVRVVRRGKETPLPWGCLPLVLRRKPA